MTHDTYVKAFDLAEEIKGASRNLECINSDIERTKHTENTEYGRLILSWEISIHPSVILEVLLKLQSLESFRLEQLERKFAAL